MSASTHRTALSDGGSARNTRRFPVGGGEFPVGAAVSVLGGFLLVRTAAMDVPSSVSFLGPRFFPAVVGTLLLLLGVALAVRALLTRGSSSHDGSAESEATENTGGSGRKPLLLTAASLLAHLLLLRPAGWIIAGAVLFWGVSCALGSAHRLRDLGISVVVAASVQLAFSAVLGLPLPSGVLMGVF
ncbi:tripartite tricarboxylate transporter TctB family protein [Actinopolyspora mortivallis]|uniref:DUF1468 domain-containing protein n=1 Tax=Actinopolyspora mortivallis TaxID=33906 RepID=A0A2T0GZM4_ACTMO|nr:tripartite tricarboxylate transporter TctB family protein [Actinopolyspora mortivallis]PRW64562.1 hypothetical protein CEP50_04195 [Actinopolyspora mortivallis]